jgi:hypothetical protein
MLKRRKYWLLAASALASTSLGVSEPALAQCSVARMLPASRKNNGTGPFACTNGLTKQATFMA